jgi:N-acetylglucosaminyldiphosphoundecaprenol N-acetyl-beta-D-mannosaminyltransferase
MVHGSPPRRVAVVMGVPVDDVTIDEAVEVVTAMVERGRCTGRTHQVATVNVDFVVNASADPELLELLQHTDLSIPDGMPLVWAPRLLGAPVRERTSGVDLLPALARRSVDSGHRIVLFGGAGEVAGEAARLLRDRYPGAHVESVSGAIVAADGTMDEVWLERLRATEADVLCVALGNPKQERWIARHGAAVGAPVAIGVGGTLDFLTGVTKRAPAWMRAASLEWLHRALSEPRRLAGRYARDLVVFGPGLVGQLWNGRRRQAAVVPALTIGEAEVLVSLRGPLPLAAPALDLQRAVERGQPICVDVAGLDHLDNVTVVGLVGLVRHARAMQVPCRFVGVGTSVARDARRLAVDGMLGDPNHDRPSRRNR